MMQRAARLAHRGRDTLCHLVLPAQVSRHKMVLHSQQTDDRLDTSRGTGCMACERFGTTHSWHLCCKDAFQGRTLAEVVIGRTCAVGIHIVYL